MSSRSGEPTGPGGGPRAVRLLTAANTCNAIGDGSFLVTAALFFTQVAGLSPAQVGLRLTIAWAAGFLLSAPMGRLADRVGVRRAAAGFAGATAVALVLATTPAASSGTGGLLLPALVAYAVAQSALGGARQALLVGSVPAPDLVAARARLHVAVNAGLAAGAGIGGVALLAGTPAAFRGVLWFDAATFGLAATILLRVPEPRGGAAPPQAAPPEAVPPRAARPDVDRRVGAGRSGVLRDRRYLAATALSAVLYLYMPTLSVVLPLYVARRTGAPGWTVALLLGVNTAGVLLLQLRAARVARDVAGAARALRWSGLLLLGSCLVLATAAGRSRPAIATGVLVLGAAVQVAGEVLFAAGAWYVGFALADPDRPGEWQGVYAGAVPLARSVGPVALTALVITWSGPGWLVLGLVFAAAATALARLAVTAAPAPAAPRGSRRRPRAGRAASGPAAGRTARRAAAPARP